MPYIDLNPPWVYMCSPSWTPLPPPSPSHPSGSSQWFLIKIISLYETLNALTLLWCYERDQVECCWPSLTPTMYPVSSSPAHDLHPEWPSHITISAPQLPYCIVLWLATWMPSCPAHALHPKCSLTLCKINISCALHHVCIPNILSCTVCTLSALQPSTMSAHHILAPLFCTRSPTLLPSSLCKRPHTKYPLVLHQTGITSAVLNHTK